MSALSDIRAAITAERARRAANPVAMFGRNTPLTVFVGLSARLGIEAETHDHKVPPVIDDVPVKSTDEFLGWMLQGAALGQDQTT